MFQGDIDPEIAAMLGTDADSQPLPSLATRSLVPDFDTLFGEEGVEAEEKDEVDLTAREFPELTKSLEEKGNPVFHDPNWYKICLSGEGDPSQRLHKLITRYLNATDPKDRGVFRQQIVAAYWDFLVGLARKTPGNLPEPKRFLLRFALIHPTLINPEDREFFSRIVQHNEYGEPIYYLDEWFRAIGTGAVKNSTTDEVRTVKTNEQNRISSLLERAQGKLEATQNLIQAKASELLSYESGLSEKVNIIKEHGGVVGSNGIPPSYSSAQRRAFDDIFEIIKNLLRIDKEMDRLRDELAQAQKDVNTLEGKADDIGASVSVDVKAIDMEFDTVRQMNRMAVGRQGNHFPILTREYYRCSPQEIAHRENVIDCLRWIESIDPEAFCRSYRNTLNRIVPYIVLLPNYGDYGICWEPFDRYNRATSRGRIAIPMYPKNLKIALLTAVGDLRWQVAKEKASYYWMEEGITGHYYQAFQSKKLKGDVKDFFIQDYITWITKESDGIQRLEKDIRGIFWRYVPFHQDIKDRLKGRSYAYQELYQRDINRSLSDGY